MYNQQRDVVLRDDDVYNTMAGRGFDRHPPEPDPLMPVVWGAIILGCLAFWAAFFYFLPDIFGAVIAIGDWLGWTAR